MKKGIKQHLIQIESGPLKGERVYGRFQRWRNNPRIFWKCERFEDYNRKDYG